ncbi:MAG TPA: ribbon-helix-helix protein, CopG family [Candidatus Bathyarchaeota archaeon]|nr:ribbon-helix-helix protein, CopG family [Candidatus Bathyarchaeota archaeon]
MKRKITIELDEALHEKLERLAKRTRLSKSAVIRLLILQYPEEAEEGEQHVHDVL